MLSLSKHRKRKLMSEINIIPFTDVILVILIVFIITTPVLIESSIKLKLPGFKASSPITKQERVNVYITADRRMYINKKLYTDIGSFSRDLDQVRNQTVVISADKTLTYGFIAKVLGLIQQNGPAKLELSYENREIPE
jgi:biopolymer transport protein ExbD